MNLRLRHALLQSGLVAALAGGLTLTSHAATADQLRPVATVRAADDPLRIQQGEVIAPLPWQLPVAGYRLTGRFGDSGSWSSLHTGLDFAVAEGTPIHAITSGVVTEAVYDGSYGNKVVVTADDGTEFWYCHQAALEVAVGQEVATGATIGAVGMTGHTTGPHLHVEIRPGGGDPVDPAASLAAHRVEP
jgi:murein DD-endopeptidase MepM/ murein hydrolase activator NlpD